MAQIVDGQQFGRFQIVSRLGRGGMASVYTAYEHSLDRTVALKVMPEELLDQSGFIDRFEREARVIAKLEHPHIVPLYAYGIDEGQPWMALRLVRGGHLGERMENGALGRDAGLDYLDKIADALDFAHSQGVVHRDLKPQNILVGERGECYVADFGIASLLEGTTRLTQTGAALGTPQYMAPEQAKGEAVGPAADIYALGIIVYQWQTGLLPFDADTPYAVMFKHVSAPLPMTPLGHLTERAQQVIARALAKSPDDRWPMAADFVRELRACLAAPEAGAAPATVAPRTTTTDPRFTAAPAVDASGARISSVPPPRVASPGSAGAPATHRSGRGKLVGAFVIMVLVAGGSWGVVEWWQHRNIDEERERTQAAAIREEAVAWQQAQEANSTQGYAQYLEGWPRGPNASEAQTRQAELNQTQREQERIKTIQRDLNALGYRVSESGEADTRTTEAIKQFEQTQKLVVTGTPDEVLARALKVEQIRRDDADWAAAVKADTETAYNAYRDKYPSGRHVGNVASRIAEARKKESALQEAARLAEEQRKAEESKHDEEARLDEERRKAENARLAAKAEEARKAEDTAWTAATTQDTEAAYEAYRSSYPAGRHVGELPPRIAAAKEKTRLAEERRQRLVPNAGFEDLGNGRLQDSQTGLVWTQSDNGRKVNWNDAKAYCEGKNMRLPTIEELRAIFDRPGARGVSCGSYSCRASPLFRLTYYGIWSGTMASSNRAFTLTFVSGYVGHVRPGSAGPRALCVSSS